MIDIGRVVTPAETSRGGKRRAETRISPINEKILGRQAIDTTLFRDGGKALSNHRGGTASVNCMSRWDIHRESGSGYRASGRTATAGSG
jgi:hypothetical protein